MLRVTKWNSAPRRQNETPIPSIRVNFTSRKRCRLNGTMFLCQRVASHSLDLTVGCGAW